MRVLVVAFSSARMIAQLAAADDWEVAAVDRFADHDLRAIADARRGAGSAEIVDVAERVEADAIVYGGGLENRPDIVGRLARGRELLGVDAAALVAVRDPWRLAAAARAAGAAMPETRPAGRPPGTAVADDGPWLRKPLRGGAGRGVRRWAGGRLRASEVLQRRIDGLPCSAVAIGDGTRAVVLGVTEQLLRTGSCEWMGNLTPPRLPAGELAELGGRLGAVCDEVTGRFGLRGAFGVDAIWDGRRAWVLEVNPRPTAALELFGAGTFAAHVRGARGLPVRRGTDAAPSGTPPRMKLVLYADRDLRAPAPDWWPAGLVADVPHAGEPIPRGAPVCTLIAGTDDVAGLNRRAARLLGELDTGVLAGG